MTLAEMRRMHRLGDHVHNGYCAGATHGGRVRATLLIDGHGREGSRTRALGVKHTAAPKWQCVCGIPWQTCIHHAANRYDSRNVKNVSPHGGETIQEKS